MFVNYFSEHIHPLDCVHIIHCGVDYQKTEDVVKSLLNIHVMTLWRLIFDLYLNTHQSNKIKGVQRLPIRLNSQNCECAHPRHVL